MPVLMEARRKLIQRSGPTSCGRRSPELDGVRGLASLSVALYHLVPWTVGPGPHSFGLAIVAAALRPAWIGLDIFFVLSGYLITGLLVRDRDGRRYFRDFYVSRALRILPCYGLVIAAMYLVYPGAGSYIALSLAFLANVAPLVGIQPVNGVLWSLAIEEHFYLAWPLAVRLLSRRALLASLAAVCCLMPVVRALFGTAGDVYYYTWFRLDGLALGATIALVSRQSARRLSLAFALSAPAVIAVGAPLGLLTRTSATGAALQPSCVSIGCAALLAFVVGVDDSAIHALLRTRVLRAAGALSYGTYLTHMIVMNGYDRVLGAPPRDGVAVAVRTIACLVAALALAAGLHRWVELPAMALRRRLLEGA